MSIFVKGEHVISHSLDTRMCDEYMVVVSVGTKYITCVYEEHENGVKIKFNNDEHRFRTDWSSYKLYHSLEEIKEENENNELRRKFKRDAECSFFSIEEIKQIYEIHNKNNKS